MNESSLFAEEVQDYVNLDELEVDIDDDEEELDADDAILLQPRKGSQDGSDDDSDERDCQVNVDDDVQSLSVISKSINTSYINLKRHNPLPEQRPLESRESSVIDLREICPELIKPTRY